MLGRCKTCYLVSWKIPSARFSGKIFVNESWTRCAFLEKVLRVSWNFFANAIAGAGNFSHRDRENFFRDRDRDCDRGNISQSQNVFAFANAIAKRFQKRSTSPDEKIFRRRLTAGDGRRRLAEKYFDVAWQQEMVDVARQLQPWAARFLPSRLGS